MSCIQKGLIPWQLARHLAILILCEPLMHLADELQAGRPGLQQKAVADRPPVAQLTSPVYTPRSTLWIPPAAKPDPLADARAAAAAGRGPLTARGQGNAMDAQHAGAPAAGGRPVQQAEAWEASAGANPWQDEQPLHPLHHQFVLREAQATDRSAGGLLMPPRLSWSLPCHCNRARHHGSFSCLPA